MSNKPHIRLEGLAKSWAGSRGVEQVDLCVAEGEFVVLLGPSGCGKSTTLRMIAGLETPTRGCIHIDGVDVTGLGPARRGLAMVFQSYALFPHLTVAENIVFGLRVRGVGAAERRTALAKAVRLTGLEGLEARKPAALSGGQRQRVALARAVVAGHRICLMDEPLSNLDAKLRHAVRQEIRALQRDLGMTVLYVTHDQTEAMAMADRIVLMNEGRIEQVGTPDEVYDNPATAFVATFVGSPPMTLLPAASLPQALRPAVDGTGAADILVGVRPEAIRLAPRTAETHPAHVTEIEYLGAESLVYLATEAGTLIARLAGRAACHIGDAVGLTWSRQAVRAFARSSGRLLEGVARAPLDTSPQFAVSE